MLKRLFSSRVAAVALAASVTLGLAAPVLAQPTGRPYDDQPLAGGQPPLFPGEGPYREDQRGDWGRNDRRNDWGRYRPDFQAAQRDCSIAAIRKAWDQGFYSAQYNEGPRLVEGRYGWELRGQMRFHNRKGYGYAQVICDIRRDGDVRVEFVR